MTNPVIPEAAVQAAARAAYIRHSNEPGFDAEAAWNDMAGTEDWERGQWELEARAALEAAAPHMLAEAWEAGAAKAWSRSTPEVNGAAYQWRHEGEPVNPYRSQA